MYLGGEVPARLELLEKGRHKDSGEEQDHAPEEDVWNVGAMGTTGAALKLPVQHLALLLAPEDTVMMMMMVVVINRVMSMRKRKAGIMMQIKIIRAPVGIMAVMDDIVSVELENSDYQESGTSLTTSL